MPTLLTPPTAEPVRRPFTVAELAERFGSLPAWRIQSRPAPGTATQEDAERLRAAGVPCELIEGTVVETAESEAAAFAALRLGTLLSKFVESKNRGAVLGADGFVQLYGGTLQQAPDVAVVLHEPPSDGAAERESAPGAPALCVEVCGPADARPETARKRREYFENGCRLCWTIYPATDGGPATCEVHTPRSADGGTGPDEGAGTVLTEADELTGGAVLPGFAVPLAKALRRGA